MVIVAAMVISKPKLEILRELQNPKTLGTLSEIVGRSKQAVFFHLSPLMRMGLVRRCKDREVCYQITELGLLILEFNSKLKRLENVVIAAGKFFSERNLAAIPREMLEGLYMLDGCQVIARENPYEPHPRLEEILAESKCVKGLSSVYHEMFPRLFVGLADDKDVELILVEDVFKAVVERAETLLSAYLRRGKMYVCDNVRLAFVVAERGFALALYRLDGRYDAQNILICRTEDAVRWGLKLFECYRLRSREVKQFP